MASGAPKGSRKSLKERFSGIFLSQKVLEKSVDVRHGRRKAPNPALSNKCLTNSSQPTGVLA